MGVPVFIQAGYMTRNGYPVPQGVDADACGAEIERFGMGRDGVDLLALRDQAREASSALHPVLTMDPDKMADKLHLIELRDFTSALHVRLVDPVTEDEFIGPRAFEPTGEPNVIRKVQITFTPLPQPPAPKPPVSIVVKPPEPVDASEAPEPAPHPEPVQVVEAPTLTERQYRMRAQFQRMADTVEDDPYFARVVAAIRTL